MKPQAAAHPTPPEASLIRIARDAMAISAESAAARMQIKFSGSRWRQIEAGFRKDLGKPVHANPGVLAHMARAVRISPERLDEVGRADAAEVLREILHQEAEREQTRGRTLGERLADFGQRLQDPPKSKAAATALREEMKDLLAEWERTDH